MKLPVTFQLIVLRYDATSATMWQPLDSSSSASRSNADTLLRAALLACWTVATAAKLKAIWMHANITVIIWQQEGPLPLSAYCVQENPGPRLARWPGGSTGNGFLQAPWSRASGHYSLRPSPAQSTVATAVPLTSLLWLEHLWSISLVPGTCLKGQVAISAIGELEGELESARAVSGLQALMKQVTCLIDPNCKPCRQLYIYTYIHISFPAV